MKRLICTMAVFVSSSLLAQGVRDKVERTQTTPISHDKIEREGCLQPGFMMSPEELPVAEGMIRTAVLSESGSAVSYDAAEQLWGEMHQRWEERTVAQRTAVNKKEEHSLAQVQFKVAQEVSSFASHFTNTIWAEDVAWLAEVATTNLQSANLRYSWIENHGLPQYLMQVQFK